MHKGALNLLATIKKKYYLTSINTILYYTRESRKSNQEKTLIQYFTMLKIKKK